MHLLVDYRVDVVEKVGEKATLLYLQSLESAFGAVSLAALLGIVVFVSQSEDVGVVEIVELAVVACALVVLVGYGPIGYLVQYSYCFFFYQLTE